MLKKIPGNLLPAPKSEIDGKIKDLNLLTKMELLDLRDRQNKLIQNTFFLRKLPDKGAKIILFSHKIEEILKIKNEEESTRKMFEKLDINCVDRESVQDVEWKGKIEPRPNTYLDSDDDSDPEDVLNILRQNTSHERRVKVIKEDESLVTSKDLEEIYPRDQIQHIKYILNKTEKSTAILKAQFKPYKTTKSDVHDPVKEASRKKHKHWEITAATPPAIKHGPVKLLNMEESVRLQSEQIKKLKDLELKRATERLMVKMKLEIGEIPENTMISREYREIEDDVSETSEDEKQEDSDNEVYDEEIDRGGVVFTVMK